MKAFLINLSVAVVWLMLSDSPSILTFLCGFVLGFLILVPYAALLEGESYVRRTVGLVIFCLLFLSAFVKANLSVAYTILFVPKSKIRPQFFEYDTSDLNHFELLILSQFITLTPGTITVQIHPSEQSMIIHCVDVPDVEKMRGSIDREIKETMLRFTR